MRILVGFILVFAGCTSGAGPVPSRQNSIMPAVLTEHEVALRYMASAPLVLTGRVLAVETVREETKEPGGAVEVNDVAVATLAVEAVHRGKITDAKLVVRDPQSVHHVKLSKGTEALFTLALDREGQWRVRRSDQVVAGEVPRLQVAVAALAKELEVRDVR